MRRSFSPPIPALVVYLVCFGTAASSLHAQATLSQVIPAESRVHDFGTVAVAAKTEHRFELTNPFAQDLHLSHVRASCGCTTPIIEDQVIKPGQTGTILARFNTGTFTGARKATLTVTITQPYRTELQLNVKGYIRRDVVLNPGHLEFGQVPEGERKLDEITLDYAGREDWKIDRIESNLPFVKATFEELSRGQGRVKYKITAGIDSNAPLGFVQNQLVIHTNDRRLTHLALPFTADVKPSIEVSPKIFALGRVKPGEPVQQRLVVRGRKPFRILGIDSETAEIRFDPTEEPKPTHLLNITLAPNALGKEGEVRGHVIVQTDHADQPLRLGLTYELETGSRDIEEPTEITVSAK